MDTMEQILQGKDGPSRPENLCHNSQIGFLRSTRHLSHETPDDRGNKEKHDRLHRPVPPATYEPKTESSSTNDSEDEKDDVIERFEHYHLLESEIRRNRMRRVRFADEKPRNKGRRSRATPQVPSLTERQAFKCRVLLP